MFSFDPTLTVRFRWTRGCFLLTACVPFIPVSTAQLSDVCHAARLRLSTMAYSRLYFEGVDSTPKPPLFLASLRGAPPPEPPASPGGVASVLPKQAPGSGFSPDVYYCGGPPLPPLHGMGSGGRFGNDFVNLCVWMPTHFLAENEINNNRTHFSAEGLGPHVIILAQINSVRLRAREVTDVFCWIQQLSATGSSFCCEAVWREESFLSHRGQAACVCFGKAAAAAAGGIW